MTDKESRHNGPSTDGSIPGAEVTAPLSQLRPAPYNPRTISKSQLTALGKAMQEYGPLGGFVFNRRTGFLVGGHQRLKHIPPSAEIHIRNTFSEPQGSGTVAEGYILLHGEKWGYRVVDWPEEKERAANIAANQHGGDWDLPALADSLKGLQALGTDMELTGFSDEEIEGVMSQWNEEGQEEEDPYPAGQRETEIREALDEGEPTRTTPGDVWGMGPHRLAVGDARDPAVVKRALGQRLADMIFTDPPYNVNVENSDGLQMQNDNMSPEAFQEFLRHAFKAMIENTRPGGPIYVCHADGSGNAFRNAFLEAGWLLAQVLIWVKSSIVMGHADYHWQHEPILYGWRPGAAHQWFGHRNKSTVLDFERDPARMKKDELLEYVREIREELKTTVIRVSKPRKNDMHPTMKPIALITPRIRNSSERGAVVLDTFAGSGSTMVAAHGVGRIAALVELDPVYADVILERWEALTGIRAEKLEPGNGLDKHLGDPSPLLGTVDHAPTPTAASAENGPEPDPLGTTPRAPDGGEPDPWD